MDIMASSAYQEVIGNPLIMHQILQHLNRNDYRNLRLVDQKWLCVVKEKFAENETIYIDGAYNLYQFLKLLDDNDNRIKSFTRFNLSGDIVLDLQIQQQPPGMSSILGFRSMYENVITSLRCSFDWRRLNAFDGLLDYLQVFNNLSTLSIFVHRGWEQSPLLEKCRDFRNMTDEDDNDDEEEFENKEIPSFPTSFTIPSIKNFSVKSHSGVIPTALMDAFFKAFPMMTYFKLNADRQALTKAIELIQARQMDDDDIVVEYGRYLSLNPNAIILFHDYPAFHFYEGIEWTETPAPLPIQNVTMLNMSKIKIWISYPIDLMLIPSLPQHLSHHANHLKYLEIRMDVTAHAFGYPEFQFPNVLPNLEELALVVNFNMTEQEYIQDFHDAISVRFDPFPEMDFAALFPMIKAFAFECRFEEHDQEEREIVIRYANKLFGLIHDENSMTLTDLKSNLFDGFEENPNIVTLDVLYSIKCAFPALEYVHPCDGTAKLEWKKVIESYAAISDFCLSI